MASHMGAAPYWPTRFYHSTRQHTMPLVPEHKTQCPPPLPPMPYCPISMGYHPYDICRWHSITTSPPNPQPLNHTTPTLTTKIPTISSNNHTLECLYIKGFWTQPHSFPLGHH